ncbi:hypothetical protein [Echinicola sp. 20G]|uniref:hypothetical protein n=1 Tax=Echinicola sp. 20G TaxID=2781961 RepID=UPI001910D63B|nr:hypothetical protein [Echinicola sp. 20G]
MKKNILLLASLFLLIGLVPDTGAQQIEIKNTMTLDSLGAAQGITFINGECFVYGDREIGMMRKYVFHDSLTYTGNEYRFTLDKIDLINHPTGIAWNGHGPTFIGNSIRLNPEGTKWKAVIYAIDWDGFLESKTLDGNLLTTIEDDACIQGTRPEYVQYQGEWMVATADYGPGKNEVRLYHPENLLNSKKTSEAGVLVGKFNCSPWVQNLHWMADEKILVLIQNQIEGRRWRFTFLDFEASMKLGSEVVIKTIDIDRADELEGFALMGNLKQGVAVSSSRKDNAAIITLHD